MRRILAALCVIVSLILGASPLAAQTLDDFDASERQVYAETAAVDTSIQEQFDPVAATDAYLARFPAEKRLLSDRYTETGYWLLLWSFLYGLAVAGFLLFSRLSTKMRNKAEQLTRFKFLQPGVYWVQYSLITTAIGFPLAIYTGYFREHQYGLSNLTLLDWLRETAIEFGTGLIMSSVAVMVLYTVLRRAPRQWWIWGAMTSISLIMFALMIHPVVVAPLTNTYTPLGDEHVRAPILQMAHAHGVSADEVWVINESEQTSAVGAGVVGMFGTQRITLNDNLLNRASLPTIKMVMAHELGHYVLYQMYYLILAIGLIFVLAFAFLRFSFHRVLARWGGRWGGIRGVDDVAGLPVLAALLSIFFFAATPVINTIFRTSEAASDQFGLSVSREPDGLAEGILLVAEYRKLEPGPLEEFIFYDHPSGRNRIMAAMRWKAAYIDEINKREQEAAENENPGNQSP